MDPDRIAQATLATYLVAAGALIVWRGRSCPHGWKPWFLYAVGALYGRFCFHWRANRKCPYLEAHPAIVIANHRSPLDPLALWVGMSNKRPIGFMMAKEYYNLRGLKFICHNLESIPVERDGKDMAATRSALRRLQAGGLLGVFPEGGIHTGPGLREANPGVAWLALRSRAPVYPVFVDCPTGETMLAPFFTFRRMRVNYGEPIDLSRYYERGAREDVIQEVTKVLMDRLLELEYR